MSFSVAMPFTICMVDRQSALGGILPNTQVLLEGKAVGMVLADEFSTYGLFEKRTQTGRNDSLCRVADVRAWVILTRRLLKSNTRYKAMMSTYARALHALYPAAIQAMTQPIGAYSDWHARLSGAAGGIPPAQS